MRFVKLGLVASVLGLLVPMGTASAVSYACNGKPATYVGTPGDDLIDTHNANDDVIVALGGSDEIYTHGGRDAICAGTGDDLWIYTGGGNDDVFGGPGFDQLFGQEGNDNLTGGPGTDVMRGSLGNDTLYAEDGERDSLHAGGGINTCYEDEGLDRDFSSCEIVR
jgi:Ca2+-binding RTX toxin-like protein